MRGKLITFEGGEGAGKSTQAALLRAHLAKHAVQVVTTREPGGTPFAERVRQLLLSAGDAASGTPLAQALLFNAARADHVARVVAPALADGKWVISDRFADSTRAYQGAAAGVPDNVLSELEKTVLGGLKPDLTILLDLPPETGLARISRRPLEVVATNGVVTSPVRIIDPFESRDLAFHQRLRSAFLSIAHAEPDRVVVVNAARASEDVAETVSVLVDARLGLV